MVNKALKKFKEQTGFGFTELLNNEDKVKEFFNNCEFDEIYLQQCEEMIKHAKEIEYETIYKMIKERNINDEKML